MTSVSTTPIHPLDRALASTSDFPERLGPVLIKELRQGLRSGLFAIPFAALPAILGLQVLWALLLVNPAAGRNTVSGFFWMAVIVPLLVLTPLRALGAVRSEREAQTLELLQLTPLTAWRIVTAKWCSLMAQAILWVVALLPFFVLRYFFGSVNLLEELVVLGWMLVGGALLTALGIVASTLPRMLFWFFVAGGAFFGLWSTVFMIGAMFNSRLFSGMLGPSGMPLAGAAVLAGTMLHGVYLFLTYAASRVAPLAENYSARLRFGTVGLFVWWGLAILAFAGSSAKDAHWAFFGVASLLLVLVTIIKAAEETTPMPVHLRPWARFGPIALILARLFLPGWPSALLFFTLITALAVPVAAVNAREPYEAAIYMLLAWVTVVFPRAVQSAIFPRGPARPVLHVALHAAGSILAIVLSMFKMVLGDAILFPAMLFPSSLFWLTVTEELRVRNEFEVLMVIAVCWFAILSLIFILRSRPYWSAVGQLARRLRPSST